MTIKCNFKAKYLKQIAYAECRNNMQEYPVGPSPWSAPKQLTCDSNGEFQLNPGEDFWSCETGILCPNLPLEPVLQDPAVPFDGEVTLERDPFFFKGQKCMGRVEEMTQYRNEYEYSENCPQVIMKKV